MISDLTTATASELIQNWEQEKRIKAMKDEEVISLVSAEEITSFRQAIACGFYWHSIENVRRLCDTVDALRGALKAAQEWIESPPAYQATHLPPARQIDAALSVVEEKQ